MRQDVVRDVENLYDQSMQFLEGEGMAEKRSASRSEPNRVPKYLPGRTGKVPLKGQPAAAVEGGLRTGRGFS